MLVTREQPASEKGGTQEGDLWRELRSAESTTAREALFALYAPLARRLVARYHRTDTMTPMALEDLQQLAYAGLLEAIDRYDPELGVPFRYFGNRRISGSILNGQAVHSEINQQISFRRRLARERVRSLGRTGTKAETLKESLGILSEIAAELAIGFMLDEAGNQVAKERDTAKDAYETLAWKQTLKLVQDELDQLPERDAAILRYHYLEGISFDQIGAILSITKGRVSQLHKAAIALLRKRLLKIGRFRLEV